MSLLADAEALAEQLTAAGIRATHDPRHAAGNRPCVLVPPPAVDYVTRTSTWRLACLASHPHGLDALAQLAQLVEQLQAVPKLYPEAADPGTYALTADQPAVPAYIVRVTT